MKKLLAVLLLLTLLASLLSACGGNTVRYDLADLSLSTVTVQHYDYNYIEFDQENNTYYLKNKVKQNGIVTKQTGTYLVHSDNSLTITNADIPSQNYFLYPGEKAYFSGNLLYVEATIDGLGDCYMLYSK